MKACKDSVDVDLLRLHCSVRPLVRHSVQSFLLKVDAKFTCFTCFSYPISYEYYIHFKQVSDCELFIKKFRFIKILGRI